MRLDGTKPTPVEDIHPEILKSTIDIHAPIIAKIINLSLRNGCFPDDLKVAEVTPIFKKNDDLDKRFASHIKVFERTMYIQIESFMEDILKLSKLLTGFRKD